MTNIYGLKWRVWQEEHGARKERHYRLLPAARIRTEQACVEEWSNGVLKQSTLLSRSEARYDYLTRVERMGWKPVEE